MMQVKYSINPDHIVHDDFINALRSLMIIDGDQRRLMLRSTLTFGIDATAIPLHESPEVRFG